MSEIDDLKAERDALAAHVDRLSNRICELIASNRVDGRDFHHILKDAPDTSLAKLKAQWQADAPHVDGKFTTLVFGDAYGAYPHGVDIKPKVNELRKFLVSHHEDGDDNSPYTSMILLLRYTLWLEQTLRSTERCMYVINRRLKPEWQAENTPNKEKMQ